MKRSTLASLFLILVFGSGCIEDPARMVSAAPPVGPIDDLNTGVNNDAPLHCETNEEICADEHEQLACVDTLANSLHCGGCHNVCAPSLQGGLARCREGRCETSCPASLQACDERCVDLQTDPDHCGACSEPCPSGLCTGGVCEPFFCDPQARPFGGGSGRSDAPFILCAPEHLQAIGSDDLYRSAHYVLSGHIDVSTLEQDRSFQPIGSREKPFHGTLDGAGFAIENLAIQVADHDQVGLFSTVAADAVITALTFRNATVTGRQELGVLAGRNYGHIEAVHVEDSLVDGERSIGLIAGRNLGFLSGCSGSGESRGGELVGGLVGVNHVRIEDCVADILIESEAEQVGGLAGQNRGVIFNSSAHGTVTSTGAWVGGLVGRSRGDSRIENSFASVAVQGSHLVGGLVGELTETSRIIDSHATGALFGKTPDGGSPEGIIGGLVGRVLDQATVHDSFATGSVSSEVREVGGLVGVLQGDAAVVSSYYAGEVLVTGSDSHYVGGLVGRVMDRATLAHSYADASVETPSIRVGGLVGDLLHHGQVLHCHSSGSVTAQANAVGGLIGLMMGDTVVTDSFSTSQVQVVDATDVFGAGGLIGRVLDGRVERTFATGNVTSSGTFAGGLIGQMLPHEAPDGKPVLRTSFATGDVEARHHAGGLVGRVDGGRIFDTYATGAVSATAEIAGGLIGRHNGFLRRSYSTGAVDAPDRVGGLIGFYDSNADTEACFFDVTTSGHGADTDSNDGVQGIETDLFADPATFSAWDLDLIWLVLTRPRLRWEF